MARQGLRTSNVVISSTGTNTSAFFGGSTATGSDFTVGRGGHAFVDQGAMPAHDLTVETAVFNYIQAIRALGRTTINTAEIAKALSLPAAAVDAVVSKLTARGVRRVG